MGYDIYETVSHTEKEVDSLRFKFNALFALGATCGIAWLYYKWKMSTNPCLYCQDLDEKWLYYKWKLSRKESSCLDCQDLDEKTEKKETFPPPLYPILKSELMDQLNLIETEKTQALQKCQAFIAQAKDIELARQSILSYVNSNKEKKLNGHYTPYGL